MLQDARGIPRSAEAGQWFLAQASRALAASLDYAATLATVARLAVPDFADCCAVYLTSEDGRLHHLEPAHREPVWQERLREYYERYPLDADAPVGVPRVLRTGQPELIAELSEEFLEAHTRDAEHLGFVREFGFRSCMIVPLQARERTFGAIAFWTSSGARRYGPDDLALAEDLAHRAALAIDHAQLYQEAQREIAERQRAQAELAAISARARCILWHADVEDQGGPRLRWSLKVSDEEAAQRFLPVLIPPGQSFVPSWYESRLPEDKARMGSFGDGEVRAGRSYSQEFRCRLENGEICWLKEDVQVETLAPGRWHAVGVCSDITERKRLEEALQQRTEQLVEADQHKDQFLALLAHELRTPLGALQSALQLLRDPVEGDPRGGRALATAERQVQQINRLMEDLLDLSRIAHGRIDLRRERLDLVKIVRETTEDRRGTIEGEGLTLLLALPPAPVWITGDAARLAQVLSNLLQNAVKFTDRGGHIVVQLTAAREGGQAAVAVRDTGIGIEPEMLPCVFERFTQAGRSLDRSRGGLGLGLALVKGLIELHGGEVRVASDGAGHGAAFTVLLPLEGEASPSPSLKEEARHPQRLADGRL